MNRTDTLLRLKRFRVDEIKRRIAAIHAMQADLERKLADLDDNVARERQRAGDSDIGRLAFPSFLRSIEVRARKSAHHLEGNGARVCRRPARSVERLSGSQVPGTGHRTAGQAGRGSTDPANVAPGRDRWFAPAPAQPTLRRSPSSDGISQDRGRRIRPSPTPAYQRAVVKSGHRRPFLNSRHPSTACERAG